MAIKYAAGGGTTEEKPAVSPSLFAGFVGPSQMDQVVADAAAFAGKAIAFALGQSSADTSFQSGIVAGEAGMKANLALGMSGKNAATLAKEVKQTALDQQVQANMGLGAGPLGVVAGATDRVWSQTVARPASTAALLANPDSPLYKTGTVEQVVGYRPDGTPIIEVVPTKAGFQTEDVQQAWQRADQVSFGQAVAANPITTAPIPMNLGGIAIKLGGLENYDPWSVSDMSDAVNNPFYNFVTGATDASLQIVVPSALKVSRLAAMERLGLQTTIRNPADLAGYKSDWERWQGGDRQFNEWGRDIDYLANETNVSRIREHPIVANSHGADKLKLAAIIQRTSDPNTVNHIALANMGDLDSLRALETAAPDHIWTLSDMNDAVRNLWLNGEEFVPTGNAATWVKQTFDTAIDRDEYFAEMRRMFTTGDGLPRFGSTWGPTRYNEQHGKLWDPIANWMSRNTTTVVERSRNAAASAKVTIREADFERTPQWLHKTMESPIPGAPVVRFMHWIGSRQPLGTVSRSGARPNDMWLELNANLDQVPMFASTKPIVVGRELQRDGSFQDIVMTPAQYRQTLVQRIVDGQTNGGLQAAWQGVEDDLVRVMAYNLGVSDEALGWIVAGYRKRMDDKFTYMQNNNAYLFDEQSQGILLSPDSQRQLLDSFPTLPLGEIYKSVRGELSPALRAFDAGVESAEWLFDQGAKIFRTNVLFRFGYIPKNSIAEPMLSSWLAHGTILTDEGLKATFGNFARNRVNNVQRARYSVDLTRRIRRVVRDKKMPRSERAQLAREMNELVRQRTLTVRSVEEQYALLEQVKAGVYGPTVRAQYSDEIRGRLVDAQIRLESIEAAMDGRIPEWRQIVEPASLPDLSVRLRELRAVTGQDEAYIREMRQELDDLRETVRERSETNSPRAAKQREIDLLQQQIDRVDERLAFLEKDYDKPYTDLSDRSVTADGKPLATGGLGDEGDLARGRDLQAIALQRQKTALVEKRDAEIAALGDVDPAAPPAPTPNEAGRIAYIEATLKRLNDQRKPLADLIADRDHVLVYHATTQDVAEKMLREGTGGSKPARPATTVTDPTTANMLGVQVGDNLPYEPGRGLGSGLYVGGSPNGLADVYGPVVLQLRVPKSALMVPPERSSRVGLGMTPEKALKIQDGYLEYKIDPVDIRVYSGMRDTRTSAFQPEIVDRIQSLQNEYDDILESFNIPAFDPARRIEKFERELITLESRIDSVQLRQGDEISKRQSVSGIRAYRGSGNGYTTIWVGGERMRVPAAFSDRPFDFGPGYRAEASAATTTRQTFDPSYFAANNSLRWQLAGGPRVVDRLDPTYWDELAHVGNRIFRSEPLIQRILEAPVGQERRIAAQWLSTPEGMRYQKTMGKNYLAVVEERAPARPLPEVDPTKGAKRGQRGVRTVLMQSTTELDDVIRLVQQYFPDERVRQMLAASEVDAGDLQRLMGSRSDLSRIVGEDLMYDPNRATRIGQGINKVLDTVWQWMATNVEDRVARWPFLVREERIQLQRRMNLLAQQGMRVDVDVANAVRQSAARAALVELEKTFYNIRRYSTPVYQARFLMSFPGAFFNSIYRYGRFTAKEPERVFLTLQMFGNLIENAGVDANGNPVGRDLARAEYLVIPGTRKGPTDTGVRIPLAAFNSFAVGLPGLSYLATYAVSKIVEKNPTAEEILKQSMGPTAFQAIFPYGIPRDAASVFFGSYQTDIMQAFSDIGVVADAMKMIGMSDDKFMQTSIQIYADNVAQWEMNGQVGDAPSFEDAIDDTRAFVLSTAGIKFVNPLSTNRPVPGQLMRDAWYEIRTAYGPGREDEARKFYMDSYGEWARWYTYSSSKYTAYIPATQDAYKRVYTDFADLTQSLVALNPDDPSMVALMTIGTDGEFSEAVNNFLRENPLPGDEVPVATKMTTEQFDNRVRVSDGWSWYFDNKPLYDAERARLVELRDNAETEFEKDYYRTWIKDTDTKWQNLVKKREQQNIPWMLDKTDPSGSKSVKAAVYLTKILQNEEFRSGPGSTLTWQMIDKFLSDRVTALAAVKNAESTEDKAFYKAQFYEYVMNNFSSSDPSFAAMFDRYFASEWTDD